MIGCGLHFCYIDAVHTCFLHVILLYAMECAACKLFECM
jgi:hypothetical protein